MGSNADIFRLVMKGIQAYSPQTFEGIKRLGQQYVPGQDQGGPAVTQDPNQPTRAEFDRMRMQALNEIKELDGAVTLLIGTRYTGKSTLAARLCEFFGRPSYAISPEETPPSWIIPRTLDEIMDETLVPPMSTLILDDLPTYASNRDYNDALVQSIEKLIPVVRKRRKLQLIICTQSSAQADKHIGPDCDLAFLKPLGLLVEERPRIAKIYRTYVDPVFSGKDREWVHRHAIMFTQSYKGVIEISEARK